MALEEEDLSVDEARDCIWMVDIDGLLTKVWLLRLSEKNMDIQQQRRNMYIFVLHF